MGNADHSLNQREAASLAAGIIRAIRDAKRVELAAEKRPAFNHTRADGPYDPCLELMSQEELVQLVKDLRAKP